MSMLKHKVVLMVLGLMLGVGAALGVTLAFGETPGDHRQAPARPRSNTSRSRSTA